jgi:hypothetical protein
MPSVGGEQRQARYGDYAAPRGTAHVEPGYEPPRATIWLARAGHSAHVSACSLVDPLCESLASVYYTS